MDAPAIAIPESTVTPINGIVNHPTLWAGGAGCEYWWGGGEGDDFVNIAAAANPSGLDGWGWIRSGTFGPGVVGSGGDFLSPSDIGSPAAGIVPGNTSHIWSPQRFGDYSDALIAERFLGTFPTTLSVEFGARWPTVANNEPGLFFGIARGAPALPDASGSLACIYSNGTNFVCAGDTNSDVGAAVDTAFHKWRIVVTSGQVEWFIDGVSQGTFVPDTDTWPQSVGVRKAAALANILYLSSIRVWYS